MIRVVTDDTPPGVPVFTTVIPVRWGDLDAEGHVNNTGCFRFMEETRMRWVSGLGLPTQPPHPVIVLLNAACHYHRPLGYPADVEVSLHAGRIGRSSAQTHYRLRDLGGQRTRGRRLCHTGLVRRRAAEVGAVAGYAALGAEPLIRLVFALLFAMLPADPAQAGA